MFRSYLFTFSPPSVLHDLLDTLRPTFLPGKDLADFRKVHKLLDSWLFRGNRGAKANATPGLSRGHRSRPAARPKRALPASLHNSCELGEAVPGPGSLPITTVHERTSHRVTRRNKTGGTPVPRKPIFTRDTGSSDICDRVGFK